MKRFNILLVCVCLYVLAWTGEPTDYYLNADNKAGNMLRAALTAIIENHTDVGYGGLYDVYVTADNLDGKVWDMYSTCSFNHKTDKCGGSIPSICACYNREHSIPQSWFGSKTPMKSDAFHIYPTDGKVNAHRENFPYGECSGGAKLDDKERGRLGGSTFAGYNGTVFEPDDEYKGDFARTYFYMAICYSGISFNQDKQNYGKVCFTYDASATPKTDLTAYSISLFLKWHRNDPVSAKETTRNDAVYTYQHNRNPFIDHPELAEYIWGSKKGEVWTVAASGTDMPNADDCTVYPIPAKDRIWVNIAGYSSEFDYEIHNLSAMSVASGSASSGNPIDVSALTEGFYLLLIKTNNCLIVKKIAIVK